MAHPLIIEIRQAKRVTNRATTRKVLDEVRKLPEVKAANRRYWLTVVGLNFMFMLATSLFLATLYFIVIK